MEWKKSLDECCADEIEEMIVDSVKAGFLSNEEIHEECEEYIEENYPDDAEKIEYDDFSNIIAEFRHKFQNIGKQVNFLKLDLAFNHMEKRGIVAEHCAGYTLSDGFEDCNEEAAKRHKRGDKITGCCFYTMQDLEHLFHNDTTLLYVAFGNYFSSPTAEEIGQMIVDELEKTGFSVNWDGSSDTRIAITNLVWDKQYRNEE